MPVPTLTTDQRREAYEKSLHLRRLRAEVKGLIHEQGKIYFKFLLDPEGNSFSYFTARTSERFVAAQGMKVYDLVTALPGVGRAKAVKLFTAAGISTTRTVAQLGVRQKERLLALL